MLGKQFYSCVQLAAGIAAALPHQAPKEISHHHPIPLLSSLQLDLSGLGSPLATPPSRGTSAGGLTWIHKSDVPLTSGVISGTLLSIPKPVQWSTRPWGGADTPQRARCRTGCRGRACSRTVCSSLSWMLSSGVFLTLLSILFISDPSSMCSLPVKQHRELQSKAWCYLSSLPPSTPPPLPEVPTAKCGGRHAHQSPLTLMRAWDFFPLSVCVCCFVGLQKWTHTVLKLPLLAFTNASLGQCYRYTYSWEEPHVRLNRLLILLSVHNVSQPSRLHRPPADGKSGYL